MQDANGSRFALVLGRHDWGACTLEGDATRTLAALWADATTRSETPLAFDNASASIALTRRVGRFRAGSGDLMPDDRERLGAAADRNGNVYAIVDGGRRISVRSAGSGNTSGFWPVDLPPAAPTPGAFVPLAAPAAPAALALKGLAVTSEQYLVAGLVPPDSGPGSAGGLLVFDLLAGGPPMELAWPAPWRLVPEDMAARADGGLVVLDRLQRRVWTLDRRLGMAAVFPLAPPAPPEFTPADGSEAPPVAPPCRPWFDLVQDSPASGEPVAVEVLSDGAVLVLDDTDGEGFAQLSVYVDGAPAGRASTKEVLDVLAPDEPGKFQLRGFDFALHALQFDADGQPVVPPLAAHDRVLVVSHEGNQAFAFDLWRTPSTLALAPDEGFLPLKRYGGLNLVPTRQARVDGDTGVLYASQGRWLPLVEQRRPRYQPGAVLLIPPFDGDEPGFPWHRLMLDGCIPPGCQVRVATRVADDADLLADQPFAGEPLPVLRPDGSELPWRLEGPGSVGADGSDAHHGRGTWELLLQRARGRWLQLRLSFEGNELATPRLNALRVWKPRFSYAQRYLPAVYREDRGSADFLERFLANFEGQFTAFEDRIAAASALFDVRSAPADTLDWLAGWLGLVLDPSMDERRRRQLIRHAMPLYQYRGTTAALRLAVQLALSDCVPDEDFELPSPSQAQPWGVRIVETYLTRVLPPALLGETTFDDGPRRVTAGQQWSLAEGYEGLNRRWRDWLAAAGPAFADPGALFRPLPPSDTLAPIWQGFCQSALGVVPQLAAAFDAAWRRFVELGHAKKLGATMPTRWPRDDEPDADDKRDEWRRFLDTLPGDRRRWVRRWQAFVASRHLRPADYRAATGIDWPEFELLPVPTTLAPDKALLADWHLFETRLEPMAAAAHAFSVLLPIAGPEADLAALQQRVDLATRVVRLAKPAHTRFDVRPYWAMFRIGQVRMGLDTLLGDGSRSAGLAPPMVLGLGHVGASRVALRPDVPADRILLEC